MKKKSKILKKRSKRERKLVAKINLVPRLIIIAISALMAGLAVGSCIHALVQ